MVTVFDLAKYILSKQGSMTAMKLHKLIYYAQAWSLVWDEEPLFREEIQAWVSGPVVPELYNTHRGRFKLSEVDVTPSSKEAFNKEQKETIDKILECYGGMHAQQLSDLTHSEQPLGKMQGRV